MNSKIFYGLALAATVVAAGCQKQELPGAEELGVHAFAYTPVTEPITDKIIDASVLGTGTGITFDTHQAWFDFRIISNTNRGAASLREAWNLAFWNGSGLNRVILNYSVTTQAKLITDVTTIGEAIDFETAQLEAANNLFSGGTFGMGDLNTFDFHREGQFVIGTPTTNNQVYLIKTPPVEVHPDTTGGAPVIVDLWLAAIRWTGSGYFLEYQGVNRVSATNWALIPSIVSYTPFAKDATHQYTFVKFGAGANSFATIQPENADWNLGLSAVTLKRYINPSAGGGAYPFAIKGVVLNNNPGVEVYRVQTTGSTAGAPGPYDPNYDWDDDPALDTDNDINDDFEDFEAADIDTSKFSSTSQEEIGQYWRYLDLGNYRVFVDRFYVVKLPDGDIYKLKFEQIGTGASTPVNNGIRIRYSRIAIP